METYTPAKPGCEIKEGEEDLHRVRDVLAYWQNVEQEIENIREELHGVKYSKIEVVEVSQMRKR
jgi:hypothetical protein